MEFRRCSSPESDAAGWKRYGILISHAANRIKLKEVPQPLWILSRNRLVLRIAAARRPKVLDFRAFSGTSNPRPLLTVKVFASILIRSFGSRSPEA
jgi:hypothetical protein